MIMPEEAKEEEGGGGGREGMCGGGIYLNH